MTGRRRRHRENRSSLAREEGGHRDATARTSAVSVGFAGAGSTAASPAAAGFFFFDLGLGLMYPPPGLFPGFFASFATIARGGVTLTTQRGRDLRDTPAMVSGSRKSNAKGRGRVINRRPNMGCGASSKPAASGPKVMVVSQPQPQVRDVWWTRRAVAREARSSDPASPRTSR